VEAIFVKFGGSLITDKTREATPRMDVIGRLAEELRAALEARPDMSLILGHGSGSFGHFAARRYSVHTGLAGQRDWMGLAQTSAAAARLNRLVVDACLQAGVPAISFQPSSSALRRQGILAQMAVEPVAEALACGLVPLVYGDVAFDAEQGTAIISTEDIFLYLSGTIVPTRVLMLGVVDGIYEADPLRNPQSRRIPVITPEMVQRLRAGLGGSHGIDVTGGMLGKVSTLLPLLDRHPGVEVHFFSGQVPGRLRDALLGGDDSFGTVLRAR
jgi:isopentenyl phosphate kinase